MMIFVLKNSQLRVVEVTGGLRFDRILVVVEMGRKGRHGGWQRSRLATLGFDY
jgi:hypothetical protein